jgi:nucleoside phosphorylase
MQDKFKNIRIAILLPLAEEYQIFRQYFQGTLIEKFHIEDITVDILKKNGTLFGAAVINQMGNVPAAVATTRLQEVFRHLDLIVNLGFAGGVDPDKQSLGDVIVAETIRYYEGGKLKDGNFEIAPQVFNLRSKVVQSIQLSDWSTWPLGTSIGGKKRQIFFGTVASGEKVVSRGAFVDALVKQDRKTVGIEMEGFGISAAISGRKEQLLIIRGISDFADKEKNDHARLSAMEGTVRVFEQALLARLAAIVRRCERKATA